MGNGKLLIAAATLASLVACAGNEVAKPTDELNAATEAMERARQANGYEFASFEMATADRKLAEARTLGNSDEDADRLRAKRLAEQVTLDARLAEAKARLAKAEVLEEEMNRSIESLRDGNGTTGGAQ